MDNIAAELSRIIVRMTAVASSALCPSCGQASMRIHSHYQRILSDLPWNKVSVRIHLHVRKFFCEHPNCKRIVFTEPLPQLADRYARKTLRLNEALYLIGYALGGEAGARVAVGLGLSVSPDTLLHRVRQEAAASLNQPPIRAVGVDDWAFRKGHRYGTILVDLDKHRLLGLLPDRTTESLADWLKTHPEIEIVSRDRASAYSQAAAAGAPQAMQVADRFHLLQNAGEMLERVLIRHHRLVRELAQDPSRGIPSAPESLNENEPPESAPVVPARPIPRSEQESGPRRQRRLERFQRLQELHQQGVSKRQIAARMGLARNTVRKWLASATFRDQPKRLRDVGVLASHLPYLKQRWQEGCRNATQLYAEIKTRGFVGSVSIVQRHVKPWRKDAATSPRGAREGTPSPRRVRWWLLKHFSKTDPLRKAQQEAFVQNLCTASPEIQTAQKLSRDFVQMVKNRRSGDLNGWLEEAVSSAIPELKSFAVSLKQDFSAVQAAFTSAYSNGQTEGQVNRLKLIKRSMYGRANFDLLQARVLPMRKAA